MRMPGGPRTAASADAMQPLRRFFMRSMPDHHDMPAMLGRGAARPDGRRMRNAGLHVAERRQLLARRCLELAKNRRPVRRRVRLFMRRPVRRGRRRRVCRPVRREDYAMP